jgi:hypothetical protein
MNASEEMIIKLLAEIRDTQREYLELYRTNSEILVDRQRRAVENQERAIRRTQWMRLIVLPMLIVLFIVLTLAVLRGLRII